MATPARPDDLVHLLRSGEAARPRLVWYAPGERIELSGKVLAQWAFKAADLLQEELDAGVGTRVRLDGAPHWRFLVWALGTWTVGGCVVTGEEDADVLVVDGARLAAGDVDPLGDTIGLTLAALARRSPVGLPPGVIDEAAVLASHADETSPLDRADGDAPALAGDASATYATLVGPGREDRIHVSGRLPLADVCLIAASTWAAGGSLVLTDPAWEADKGDAPESPAFAEILESEGVSARRD